MPEVVESDRPWFHTVALLANERSCRPPVPTFRSAQGDYRQGSRERCAIKVLERQGRTVATVAWSDSTACCYGEQLWRRCIARKNGVCALSGQTIARGDAVYRPRIIQPPPRNIDAMILATVMEALPSAHTV